MAFITVAVIFAYFSPGLGLIAGQLVITIPAGILDVTDPAIMADAGWNADFDQYIVCLLGIQLCSLFV